MDSRRILAGMFKQLLILKISPNMMILYIRYGKKQKTQKE